MVSLHILITWNLPFHYNDIIVCFGSTFVSLRIVVENHCSRSLRDLQFFSKNFKFFSVEVQIFRILLPELDSSEKFLEKYILQISGKSFSFKIIKFVKHQKYFFANLKFINGNIFAAQSANRLFEIKLMLTLQTFYITVYIVGCRGVTQLGSLVPVLWQ